MGALKLMPDAVGLVIDAATLTTESCVPITRVRDSVAVPSLRTGARVTDREAVHGWATCALTQLGFLRLSSNPAYTSAHATPREAAALLGQPTTHAAHH